MQDPEPKLKCPKCGMEIETMRDLVEHKRTCKAKVFDVKPPAPDSFGRSVRTMVGWILIILGVPILLISIIGWCLYANPYYTYASGTNVGSVFMGLFAFALICIGYYVRKH
jgi:hypothetical protein